MTEIEFKMWKLTNGTYSFYVDKTVCLGKVTLEDCIKEIKKYSRLRFKESLK